MKGDFYENLDRSLNSNPFLSSNLSDDDLEIYNSDEETERITQKAGQKEMNEVVKQY